MKEFTLVVPVYNSGAMLSRFISGAESAFAGIDHEIIFVDDASTDSSIKELIKLKKTYPAIKVIKLEKNRGQSLAAITGIFYTQTPFGAITDIDMAGSLGTLRAVFDELKNSELDLIKISRRNIQRPVLRNACSRLMSFVFNAGSGIKLNDIGSGCYIAKSSFFKKLAEEKDSHLWRFLPFLVVKLRPGMMETRVDLPGQESRSSYSIAKLLGLAICVIRIKIFILLGLEALLPKEKIETGTVI